MAGTNPFDDEADDEAQQDESNNPFAPPSPAAPAPRRHRPPPPAQPATTAVRPAVGGRRAPPPPSTATTTSTNPFENGGGGGGGGRNPFDDDAGAGGGVGGGRNPFEGGYHPPPAPSQQRHPQQTTQRGGKPSSLPGGGGSGDSSEEEDAIFAARGVDWPLPSHLSRDSYARLRRISAGGSAHGVGGAGGSSSMGGLEDDNAATEDKYSLTSLFGKVMGGTSSSSTPSTSAVTSSLPGAGGDRFDPMTGGEGGSSALPLSSPRKKCVAAGNGWIVAAVECAPPPPPPPPAGSSGTPGSTVSGASSGGTAAASSSASSSSVPPLRLVHRWNVRRADTSGATETDVGGGGASTLIPLPPPKLLPPVPTSSSTGTATPPHAQPVDYRRARVEGVFVDPTGHHVLISCRNGELFHLHSTSRRVRRLPGFGPDYSPREIASKRKSTEDASKATSAAVDASPMRGKGKTPTAASGTTEDKSGPQGGIPPHVNISQNSYVTSVGWDRERGTEGSTKNILLGTSRGRVYEYALYGPSSSGGGGGGGGSGGVDKKDGVGSSPDESGSGGGANEEWQQLPTFLTDLHASDHEGLASGGGGGGVGLGAVTGLHFERVSGGRLFIIAATSGRNKRTRLHTFRGRVNEPNNFRSAFRSPHVPMSGGFKKSLSSGKSFVELPGSSSDRADLAVCGDGFALQCPTGVYHGTIDLRNNGMVTESGMLPYRGLRGDCDGDGGDGEADAEGPPATSGRTTAASASAPSTLSIALTPHHILTLSGDGTVRFVNRVAERVVQREVVDFMMPPSEREGVGELIMDVRRPDQVWLRHGRTLVHISSSCEDRDVWRFTLERCLNKQYVQRLFGMQQSSSEGGRVPHGVASRIGDAASSLKQEEKIADFQFEHAKSLCTNSAQKAVVGVVRAEYHLARGTPTLAAKHLAQAPAVLTPFSKTALRLCLPGLDGMGLAYGGDDTDASAVAPAAAAIAPAGNVDGSVSSKYNTALISFLTDKLRMAAARNDSAQCAMMGAWLVELHLHEKDWDDVAVPATALGQRRLGGHKHERTTPKVGSADRGSSSALSSFLTSHAKSMDAQTTIRILASHDVKASDCAGYAAASGDIGTAVNAALSGDFGKKGALDAIRVLNDAPIEKAEPFYYKHAVALLSRAPMQAAKSFLLRYQHGLQPTKLLPALMQYERRRIMVKEKRSIASKLTLSSRDPLLADSTSGGGGGPTPLGTTLGGSNTFGDGIEVQISSERAIGNHRDASGPDIHFVDDQEAAVKYLEGVIKAGCQSVAICNYLVSLYASFEDEAPLFRFLSATVPAATRNSAAGLGGSAAVSPNSPLDMSYALRMILKTGRHYRSAVKLYMGFGLRQQAVELALKVDPALARELARDSVEKQEKKRLWLMIARNAAAEHEHGGSKDVVAKVVSVLKDCGPDILSIEDVLPFLPDFAQIDQFKDEICGALTSYSSKIDHYLQEMNECDQTCDALREEISRLEKHEMQMRADARCAFTKKRVIDEDEPFYVFPSGFVALEGPLKKEVLPHLNQKQRERVHQIEQQLSRLRKTAGADEEARIKQLQSEMDGLIAAECPLTGVIMVESIDEGFSSMDEDDLGDASQWLDMSRLDSGKTSVVRIAGPPYHSVLS